MAPSLSYWIAVQTYILQTMHIFFILLLRILIQYGKGAQLRTFLISAGLRAVVDRADRLALESPSLLSVDTPPAKPLLPPRDEGDDARLTIVLDLDETLVCAYNAEDVPEYVRQAAAASGVSSFELECFTADLDASGEPERAQVTVFERPGLREFLRRASRLGELVLFTAGLEGYARPLVDRIDPDGLISARLYRPATVSIGTRQHVKDLAGLGRDLRRTVIIDNNPFAFLLQPVNGVPCVPFFGGEGSDRQLLQVLLPLLETLSVHPHVRPFLSSHFHMLLRLHPLPLPHTPHFPFQLLQVLLPLLQILSLHPDMHPVLSTHFHSPFPSRFPSCFPSRFPFAPLQLLQVLLPLLETLSLQPDVRPFLSSHFRMPLWLRAHGVPVVDHHPT
ncbi:unnamed protein product [Closterium sp. NIES-64]|nr:unnamed protein product [Closterium sp. NIES-64]